MRKRRENDKADMQKNENDMILFEQQLASCNLKLNKVYGDGNCLFRAIAD